VEFLLSTLAKNTQVKENKKEKKKENANTNIKMKNTEMETRLSYIGGRMKLENT